MILLFHIMGTTPILEMARAYGLRPRLWLLVDTKNIELKNNRCRQEKLLYDLLNEERFPEDNFRSGCQNVSHQQQLFSD